MHLDLLCLQRPSQARLFGFSFISIARRLNQSTREQWQFNSLCSFGHGTITGKVHDCTIFPAYDIPRFVFSSSSLSPPPALPAHRKRTGRWKGVAVLCRATVRYPIHSQNARVNNRLAQSESWKPPAPDKGSPDIPRIAQSRRTQRQRVGTYLPAPVFRTTTTGYSVLQYVTLRWAGRADKPWRRSLSLSLSYSHSSLSGCDSSSSATQPYYRMDSSTPCFRIDISSNRSVRNFKATRLQFW